MPPRSHSSSSHSSSSHRSSSHSSSSSHSRSSHRSSSVSHKSYSSHRSSSLGGGYSASRRANGSPYPQFTRARRNQPTGYHSAGDSSYKPKAYHCKRHDYLYYSRDWTDETTGKFYRKGYYDEDGKFYENLTLTEEKSGMTIYICPYCGNEVKEKWESGVNPLCPGCNAQLVKKTSDVILEEENVFAYTPESTAGKGGSLSKKSACFIAIFVIAFLTVMIGAMVPIIAQRSQSSNAGSAGSTAKEIYVEEIGRTCKWDRYSESYYDVVTDCYFWYNDTVDYPDWQYWYEGISSNYGDYGWMEYDSGEDRWYIEVDHGEWIVLPSEYLSERLWHFVR